MRKFYFLLLLVLFAGVSNAQLTGTKTIPGDYASIAAAVADLNAVGVGAGGVIFNVASGHTETTTALIDITATGTAADPIVFQKSGAGANPVITRTDAGSLSTSATGGNGDAVIRLWGTDYITFTGVDVSATDQGIEYGYYATKPTATNGCKNVTIQNCMITMTKGTSANVIGIHFANGTTSTSSATGFTMTSTDGINENVVIKGNTIQNVHSGIYCRGGSAAAFHDKNFTIGGGSGDGNIVRNFGGGAASTCYGSYFIYVDNPTVSYNNYDNAGGGGSPHASTFYGVFFSSGVLGDLVCSNNQFTISSTASSSSIFPIYSGNTLTTENYSNNTFASGTITTSGTCYLIYASNGTPNKTISGNSISGSFSRSTGGIIYCYYNLGSPASGTETIANNNFSNITNAGTSSTYGIYTSTATGQSRTCTGNTLTNWTTGGTTYAIYALSSLNNSVAGNVIKDFTITGTGTVYGIYTSGTNASVYNNTIGNLSAGGSTVYGIFSLSSTSADIYNNKLYNLSSTASTTNLYGLYLNAATTTNAYNNLIGGLSAPNANNGLAIAGIYANSGTNINLYHNTVNFSASSVGANFGSAALYSSTTPTLTLNNNILVNSSTPGSGGITAAYRRSSTTIATYAGGSNNNLFYAGLPSAQNVVFNDGTNSDITMGTFKTRVAPSDAASVTENPTFVSTTGTDATFLHINTTTPTQIESGGTPIVAVSSDFDGDVRNATTPDIGADEFNGVVAPPMVYVSSTAVQTTTSACVGASNVPVLRMEVVTTGIASPLELTSLTVNANGTTNFTDISGYRIYYTGNNSTFSTSLPIMASATGITGTNVVITPASALPLLEGTNYFWLAYDISATAVGPNVDAEFTDVTLSTGGGTPTVTAPAGASAVNPFPTATITLPPGSVCAGDNVTLTGGTDIGTTFSWTGPNGFSSTDQNPIISNITAASSGTYSFTATASGCSTTAIAALSVYAVPVFSSTTTSPLCVTGTPQLISATLTEPVSVAVSSGALGLPIPDNNLITGLSNTLTVAGIPAGTAIDSVVVTLNITHTYDGDLDIYLEGPNGNTIELSTDNGASGDNYINTVITSSSTAVPITSGSAPFTGTYRAEGYLTFNTLYSIANGGWKLKIFDDASGDVGTLNNWSIQIYYTDPTDITWSPLTALFTDAAGTVAYTGTASGSVYANPSIATTYTATATSSAGCTSTATVEFAQPAQFTVTGGGAYCVGGSGVEVGLSGSEVGVNYQLVLNGTTNVGSPVAGTGAAISFGVQTTVGTYIVVATNATTTCENTMTGTVSVSTNPLPTPSITVAETSGLTNNDGTICAGASASLTASGGSTYSWSSGETTAAITISPAVTTTYTVTATDANGCQNTASSTITVDALPTVYNVTGGGSYCAGGLGSAVGLSSSDVGVSYELYAGGTATGNIVTGTGSAISFGTITTAGTYTVVASNAATGCVANMSGSATVSVGDVPVINYTLTQPNNCNSNNGGADLTITGAAGPYTYNWTGLGIIQGDEDQSTLRVGSYTVVVTAANGCDATANFTLIGPGGCDVCPAIGAVSTTPTAICQDGTASLSATGLADMGVSYGIDFVVSSSPLANPYTGTVVATVANADLSGGGTGASASYTFTTSGTQYIYAILSPAPADPACRPFQTVQLEVVATPDVNTVPNQTVCSGALTAAVNFSGSVPGTTYNWTNSNPSIGLAASGTGDISSFTATNFTNAPVTSTVTVTPVNVAGLNQVINGAITGTSTLPERMFRDGVPSSCASPKAFPGVFSTGSFPYTTYTFTNTSGSTQCVSASVVATSGDVFLAAYTNSFNPSNLSQNYLADAGSSSASPTSPRGMTFNVPSGSTYVTVLNTTVAPTATFDLTLTAGVPVSCPGPSKTFTITVNPIPTVNTVAPVAACNGATVSVPFSGFVPGTVYEWTNSNTAIGLAASGTGDLSFTGTNSGTTPITANIVVTPKYTNNGQTCTGTPIAFTITINPTPTINAVSNQVVCNSGATTAVAFSGAVTGTTYSWTNSAPSIGLAASGTGDIASFTAVNTTNAPVVATITVTPNYTNGGTTCSGTATTFTITVNPQGQVNTVSNQTICNGANTTAVNFSTNNTGVTTTYSWTNSNTSIGLAASGTGNIPSFAGVNTGTTPVTATVTVTPSYTIPGGSTTFTPVSIPSPVTHNVYDRLTTYTGVSVNGGGNAATVTPGSTVTLSYNYSVAFPGGFCPGCVVQNQVGLGGTSQTLNCVNPVNNGSNGSRSLTFTAPTTPGIYYIQHGTTLEFSCIPLNFTNNPSGGGAYGAGAAIASIVVPDATTCTGTPTTFTFTVNPTPTVNAVSSEVVCNNASTTAVTFSGAVTGTVYNWTNSNTAIGLAASGTGNIASFTATNNTNAPITATITVTPSYTNDGVTCTGTSTSYTITVNPTPTVNAVSNQTLCNGAATTAVTFSGAVTGTVYSWTNNTTSIGLAASGTGDIASFTATNTTNAPVTATITVTPSFLNGGTLCTGTPTTFTITVNPTPNAVATPAAQTICSANAITGIVLTGNVTGTTYSWTRDNTTAVTGIAASGTGNIAGTLTNTTSAPVTVTFTITPSANGCTGTPITATVLVNPTPVLTPDPFYSRWVCSGTYFDIEPGGFVNGTTITWTRDNIVSVTGIPASGTGDPAGTPVNTTNAPVTVTFTIIPTANGCTGAPYMPTLTVNPIPTVNAVSNQVVCNRSMTTAVAFTGAVTGTVYSWTNNTPSIGLAASGTGNIAAFTAVNTTQAPIVATITVTPSFTNGGVTCTGTPRTFTITVNPTPIVTATDLFNQRICISDAPIALNATPVGGSWSGIGVSGFSFVPSAAAVGNYLLTYTYTNQFGCTSTDTTTAKVSACDERNRSLEAGGAILYPNPNGGQFNIRVNSTRFQFLQMRIYNALGQLISTKQWNGLTFGQILPVDMRHLPAAVYTVRIIYDGGNLYEDRGYQMLIQH